MTTSTDWESRLREYARPRPQAWYQAEVDWVLTHGEEFPPGSLPDRFPRQGRYRRRAEDRAATFVEQHPGFRYAEGFVRDGRDGRCFPHAWVVDEDGRAIDLQPTAMESAYFGVAIEAARLAAYRRSAYGRLYTYAEPSPKPGGPGTAPAVYDAPEPAAARRIDPDDVEHLTLGLSHMQVALGDLEPLAAHVAGSGDRTGRDLLRSIIAVAAAVEHAQELADDLRASLPPNRAGGPRPG